LISSFSSLQENPKNKKKEEFSFFFTQKLSFFFFAKLSPKLFELHIEENFQEYNNVGLFQQTNQLELQ